MGLITIQQWLLEFDAFSLPILLFFFISIFFLIRFNRVWPSKNPKLPPSPPKLPFIGNLHQVGMLPHRSFCDLSTKYGPLMLLHLGQNPTLVVSSAEMAREIMKNQDVSFANRPNTTAAKMLLYGCTDVAFAPYGEYWRQVRRICVLVLFSIKRVQAFRFVREEEIADMIENIRSCLPLQGATINLSQIVIALSNNIVSRCALGMKHEGEDGKNRFGELSREMMRLIVAFSIGDLFPLLGWMDTLTGLVRRLKRVSKEVDIFLDQVIEEHLIQRKNNPENKKDFVDILLHVQKDNMLGINLTSNNIKAIILDMFVGGSDTSSTTIEWAMAELVKNPNAMKKAQEEVRRVVGKKSKVGEEDINQMDYLKCVIKETLRLHAPLPILVPRESTITTNVKGYKIPSKTRVLINAWAIQRDPKLWDNPEEFIPERFSNNTIDCKGQEFEFIPFGSGRRGCPGMSFGLAVVEFVVANLLYWFDWESPHGAKGKLDMTEAPGLTVTKKTPLHLIPIAHFS